MLTTLLRDFTLPSQQLVRQSVHHNKNLPHGPWICGLSLTQNNAAQQWLSGHWCGVARGYTQGSLHGSQKGFRCEVILHLFLHWLVLAKGSFTQGPHLPFGMVSKSWVSLFPVFFHCDRACWLLLMLSRILVFGSDWLVAPHYLLGTFPSLIYCWWV